MSDDAATIRPQSNGVISAAVRLLAAVSQFGALAVLANRVSVSTFGLVSFAILGSRLVAVVAAKGLGPQLLAGLGAGADPTSLPGLIWSRMRWAVAGGAVLALSAVVVFDFDALAGTLVAVAFVFIGGMTTVLHLTVESLKRLGAPSLSIGIEFLPTAAMLLFAAGVESELGDPSWGAQSVVVLWCFAAGQALSAAIATFLHRRLAVPAKSSADVNTSQEIAALPLLLSTGLSFVLPVGAIAGAGLGAGGSSAGHVSAVLRLVSPSMIVLAGVAATLVPQIGASLHGSPGRAASRFVSSQRFVFGLAAPYQFVLLAFPGLAEVVFGDRYEGLSLSVRIVAVGQLVNGATGLSLETAQLVPGGARRDVRTVAVAAIGFAVLAWVLSALDLLSPTEAAVLWFSGVLTARSLFSWLTVRKYFGSHPRTESLEAATNA